MTPGPSVLVWFRDDLRLSDHRALAAAAATGLPVVPCYVLDTAPAPFGLGGASRWWLHRSLAALARAIAARGGHLVLRHGRPPDVVPALAAACGARAVFVSRRYASEDAAVDRAVAARLERDGVEWHAHSGSLLFEPDEVRTRAGRAFRVFTPFWRACDALARHVAPACVPEPLALAHADVASDSLEDWRLTPQSPEPDWSDGLARCWTPGLDGAHARLDPFLADGLAAYADTRDAPAREGTSRLSPHLRFGELGPAEVRQAVQSRAAADPDARRGAEAFLRELGWREFCHHLLHHWPGLPERPFRPEFERFDWLDDAAALAAWQRGATGYPLVDAGMRELWATGWMHNRVRMVAASFLVKHLRVPWQRGAAWFWDTLVDADLASNSANWQWVAGSGADAAPYFRVFNPVLQSRRFDARARYVRTWVPELAALPDAHVHAPWEAPAAARREAGIELGRSYPAPIVDHAAARAAALAAFRRLVDG